MARPKTPEGKRVTICAKFSEAQAAEIDAARGSMDRSEWLRLAALAAAGRQRTPARKPRTGTAPAVTFTAPLDSPNARIALGVDPDCPHPKARINKGLCGNCGTNVAARASGGNQQ